jgi:hypothetical protein
METCMPWTLSLEDQKRELDLGGKQDQDVDI